MENREKFKEWLEVMEPRPGITYDSKTVNSYYLALNKLNDVLRQKSLFETDIFEITDEDKILKVIKIFNENKVKEEFKSAVRSYIGTLSSVLKRYTKFLTVSRGSSIDQNLSTNTSINNENYIELAQDVLETAEETPTVTLKGENVIFYGVPGSGKSYSIQERIKNVINPSGAIDYDYSKINENISRVVFHPDYTYSDFTGQILPTTDENGHVKYVFKEGPFTSILRRAVFDKTKKPYFLIIEEINRGNASAIFGDIFQLLDRDKDGVSEYSITNAEIAQCVFNDKKKQLRLPENL
ncbi:MAG: AAA family ATPase [Christensenellaceae bacterium]|nr:AAA family ATPase [Christensenellaceae bacterium]